LDSNESHFARNVIEWWAPIFECRFGGDYRRFLSTARIRTRTHLPTHNPKPVDIGLFVVFLTAEYFRRHIRTGPHSHSHTAAFFLKTTQSKVTHFRIQIFFQLNTTKKTEILRTKTNGTTTGRESDNSLKYWTDLSHGGELATPFEEVNERRLE
jgi:hypothetical protein